MGDLIDYFSITACSIRLYSLFKILNCLISYEMSKNFNEQKQIYRISCKSTTNHTPNPNFNLCSLLFELSDANKQIWTQMWDKIRFFFVFLFLIRWIKTGSPSDAVVSLAQVKRWQHHTGKSCDIKQILMQWTLTFIFRGLRCVKKQDKTGLIWIRASVIWGEKKDKRCSAHEKGW